MASKIRIFRSTGATAPSSLEYGELAVTVEQGTAGSSANKAGRLFIGNASGNPVEIGGEYTYKLMDHTHGELINSSVAIVDASGQIDGWSVAGILTATRTAFTDTVTTNLNVTGVASFAQGINLNGDVTIGDSHLDTLTVNSRAGFNTDVTLNTALLVSGISTFTGVMDVNGGADVSGGAGLVVSADGINVSGGSTFNNNVLFSGTIDVDGQAIFDDITVSAASTFTGPVDINGGADINGGLVANSAQISDLTDNRVVISGASGELEDDANLTYDGTDLSTNSLIVTDLTDNRVLIAGTGGSVEDDGNLTFDGTTLNVGATVDATIVDAATLRAPVGVVTALTSTDVVGAAGTFTTAFTLGTGGTKFSFPVADGVQNQILQTDGAGNLSFVNVAGGFFEQNATGIHTLSSVGIGTTTANTEAAKLVVQGQTRLDGDLNVTGIITSSGGLVIGATVIGEDITTRNLNVTGLSTFTDVVDINNNVTVSGTLDVDAQAIFDDVTVSAAMTVTGAVDFNGGLDVSGGETVLSSATVSDLTDNRVVVAGTSGALEDDGNLTYDGTDLSTNSLIVTDLTNTRVLFAGTGGAVEDSATLTFNGSTFTAPDLNVTTDARVGGALTVFGNLTVEGTETIINVERLDVQDKTVGVASTSTADNTTANGGGFFVHGGGDGDKEIFWFSNTGAFEVNVGWFPRTDDALDLGNATHEWRNIFIDGLAELDDVNVSAAATIATVDINGGAIDGTTIGAASTAAGSFTTGTFNTITVGGSANLFDIQATSGDIDGVIIGAASSAAGTFTTLNATSITANGGTLDAGDVTFTNLRVTGVSTVASLFLSGGTNTNGAAYFDANGQLQSTATPSAGIQTSNFILTTNASGVPSWTDTIDCGQF